MAQETRTPMQNHATHDDAFAGQVLRIVEGAEEADSNYYPHRLSGHFRPLARREVLKTGDAFGA
jgi:hypothetical protein